MWNRDRDRGLDEPLKGWESGLPRTTKENTPRIGLHALNTAALRLFVSGLFRGRLGLQLLTAGSCLSWMSASSWAILVNKHIMVDLKFPYPCTIAWMGLLTTTITSYAAMRVFLQGSAPRHHGSLASLSMPLTMSLSHGSASYVSRITTRYYLTRVLPTGFFMALTFQTGNMGYLYLTVAFVQMLKAFCPVVTMVLLFVARLEAASSRLVAAVTLIAVGVAMASYGELNLSLFGLAAMLVSVVAESVRLVLTQYLLAAPGSAPLHPVEGLFYISSACTAVLAVQASYGEWPRLLGRGDYLTVVEHPLRFAAAACSGFLVNMLAITVIKLASSLTLKVLGTVKDAALVTIGIVFLHERVTGLQLVGYTISMAGFVAYNLIKARQHHQQGQGLGRGSGGGPGGPVADGLGLGEKGGGGGDGTGQDVALLPLYSKGDGMLDERERSKAR